jgi:hypothetical protein
MLKFDFSVQTRDGQKIDSIQIAGKDQDDAQRKLLQMYRSCTVLRCDVKYSEDKLGSSITTPSRPMQLKPVQSTLTPQRMVQATSVEDILTLISKQA